VTPWSRFKISTLRAMSARRFAENALPSIIVAKIVTSRIQVVTSAVSLPQWCCLMHVYFTVIEFAKHR
jgi:hypothetical protein